MFTTLRDNVDVASIDNWVGGNVGIVQTILPIERLLSVFPIDANNETFNS